MEFIKKNHDNSKKPDAVFAVAQMAAKDPDKENLINATLGSLYGDDGKLLSFETVFKYEKLITNTQKTSYSEGIEGNKAYREAISKWVLEDYIKLPSYTIATTGGTGAISLSITTMLNEGNTLLIPDIHWSTYSLMALEYGLKLETYDVYDLNDLFNKMDRIINNENKLYFIINSPCQNPTGMSLTLEQWQLIVDKMNSYKDEVILLNDVAYVDFAASKEYLKLFNNINDNVLIQIAFSVSKSFSYYGQRLGALITVYKDQNMVDFIATQLVKKARCQWSNCNNAAMINISNILNNHIDEYVAEKNKYVEMLNRRAQLFIKEAKENNIEYYPYTEGFFITLKMPDNDYRDRLHQKLMDNHIYTICFPKGLRIALCGLSYDKVKGLASKIRRVINEL